MGQRLLYLLPASYTPFKPGSRPRSKVTSSPSRGSLLVTKVYRTEVDTSCCVHWQTETAGNTHQPPRCARKPACWWLKSNFPSRENPSKLLSLGLAWRGVPSSPPLHREPSQGAFFLPSLSSYKCERLIMAWPVLGSGVGERGLKEVIDLRGWHYLINY